MIREMILTISLRAIELHLNYIFVFLLCQAHLLKPHSRQQAFSVSGTFMHVITYDGGFV